MHGAARRSGRPPDAGVVVQRHSCLYETAPAYVTDQPAFLNAAMVVRVERPATAANPVKLLDVLKRVERDLGRAEGGRRFGPRPIDLDIIFHERGDRRRRDVGDGLPHPRYAEPHVLLPRAARGLAHGRGHRRRRPAAECPDDGYGMFIYHTADGGASWEEQYYEYEAARAEAEPEPRRRRRRPRRRRLQRLRLGSTRCGAGATVDPQGHGYVMDSFSDGGAGFASRDDADTDAESTAVWREGASRVDAARAYWTCDYYNRYT